MSSADSVCTFVQSLTPLAVSIPMNRPAAVKLPTLDFSSSRFPKNQKDGARGPSLVKVEQIGNRSVEEVIDRDVYLNINADWVNAKGCRKLSKKPSALLTL